ncbi:MAG: sulfatase [Acidobacteriota bacterium]
MGTVRRFVQGGFLQTDIEKACWWNAVPQAMIPVHRQRPVFRLAGTALLAVVLALPSLACRTARQARPNILFIVVDTLRPDHLGCYGSRRPVSPAMDELAARSVRFSHALASAPWTLPSIASMLTGLYPSAHRATHIRTRLSLKARTLAERLKEQGYRTAGIVSHTFLSTYLNMNQGFEIYSEKEAQGEDHLSTPGVTDQALQVLRLFKQVHQPFFLFVHYFDPHYRYRRHPEVGFAPSRAGRLQGNESIEELRAYGDRLGHEEVDFLRDLYDEEIRYTDGGIDRLLRGLREEGFKENTVVILAGDHGEEFLERGWLGHTRTLYQELIRVPLLIGLPRRRQAGRVVEEAVSLVSLVPTILELAGIEVEPGAFQSPSLVPALEGSAEPSAILSEVDFVAYKRQDGVKEAHKKALIVGAMKLIRDESQGRLEMYDLVHDPAEVADLSQVRVQEAAAMDRRLEEMLRKIRLRRLDQEERKLDPEEIRHLEGLGYIGSDSAAPAAGKKPEAKGSGGSS